MPDREDEEQASWAQLFGAVGSGAASLAADAATAAAAAAGAVVDSADETVRGLAGEDTSQSGDKSQADDES